MVDTNGESRLNMAVAFRALDKLGFNEGIDNNLSVMAAGRDDTGEVMLINPYGLHWREIRASSLVGVNEDGVVVEGDGTPSDAAAVHLGIRKVRPNSRCIMHSHMIYATTLGILKDPTIKLFHQDSARVYDKVAYLKDYTGLFSTVDDGRELGQMLGNCDAMLMQNHGVLTCGEDVAGAFDLMYYLERACMFQVLAFSTGQPLQEFPLAIAQQLKEEYSGRRAQAQADCHFTAIKRQVIKDTPDVVL